MSAAHRLPVSSAPRHGRRRATFVAIPLEHRIVSRQLLAELLAAVRASVELPRWLVAALPAIGLLGTASGWATYLLHR